MTTKWMILATTLAAAPALADFTTGNLVVSTVGDGSAALTNAATAVFLREYSTGGSFVRSVGLPTAASGLNHAFSSSGSATSEGQLTRSADGNFLMIAGYDAIPGTAAVVGTSAATNPRVVARISNLDIIDTTTALTDAYSANNIRSVTSADGSAFWTGGTASSGGGVRYATLGGSTSTQLSTTITNIRVVNIFGGQLYCSSATGAFQGVSAVGSGVPTTSGQTITLLPGFPTASGPSSYDYWLADATTMYVADDRASAAGGLQKWTLSSGTWSLAYTLQSAANVGLRSIAGTTDSASGNFQIYGVSTDNKLVSVIDGGSGSLFSTLATAPANTAFRGVEFTPIPSPGSIALLGLSGLTAFRRRRSR